MGNTYSSELLPKMYAGAQQVLREQTPLLSLVSREDNWQMNSLQAAQKGSTVVIQRPTPLGTAGDFTPSMTPSTPSAMKLSGVSVALDQWKKQDFYVTADEALNYLQNNIIPNQMQEAVRSVANAINKHLYDKYPYISGISGTAGTGVFASSLDPLASAAKILDDQLCPGDSRHFIMTTKDKEAYLSLDNVQKVNEMGADDALRMGKLGEKLGFRMTYSNYVPKFTTGAGIAASLTVATAATIGDTTVSVTDGGGASAFAAGDVVTFSGDTTIRYSLPTATTVTTGATATITLNRPLEKAVAQGETLAKVTASGTAYQCLAGDMRGFGIAFRDPAAALRAAGGSVIGEHFSGIDPMSGAVLTLSMIPGDMMTAFRVMAFFGGGVVQPAYLARVATYASL